MKDHKEGLPDTQNLFAMALQHHQAGQLIGAASLYKRILQMEPCHSDSLHLLGVIAHQSGQNDVAADLIRKAIRINAVVAAYQSNLGITLRELGMREEAAGSFRNAISLKPDYAEAFCNLGVALNEIERHGDAAKALLIVIRWKADYSEAHVNLGIAYKNLGKLDQAAHAFKTALCLRPDYAEVYCNIGNARKEAGDIAAALKYYFIADFIKPHAAETLCNIGVALQGLRKFRDSLEFLDAAVRIRPDYAEGHLNRGNALQELGALPEALIAYRAALCIHPSNAKAWSNIGIVLRDLGQSGNAIIAFHRAIGLKPDLAQAHYNLALTLLSLGRYREGWAEHEWRWKTDDFAAAARNFAQPLWNGEALEGKAILIHAEQGIGDTVQFCRYLPFVAAKGGPVYMEAPHSILRLLRGVKGVRQFVAKGDDLPSFNFQCPLMSLPKAFDTMTGTIPGGVPYLTAEPEKVLFWQDRLSDSAFRVGIAWQGNPAYKRDLFRSFPLACFEPLSHIGDVKLISLQRVHGLDQLKTLPKSVAVHTFENDFDQGADALIDTAAVMMSLDLIITADTAIGHLAGALGRPVWLILSRTPHWVWMLDRDNTPWYPTMRLFRQRTLGNWTDVFERVASRLAHIVSAKLSSR